MTVKERFEVRTVDVLRDGTTTYRIIENSNRGIIATYARADTPDRAITVGTLAIDKPTGDFVLGVMVPGAPLMNKKSSPADAKRLMDRTPQWASTVPIAYTRVVWSARKPAGSLFRSNQNESCS